MSSKVTPLFFDQLTKIQLLAPIQGKDQAEKAALPVIRKLGALQENHSCLPSANKEHTIADASIAFRSFHEGLQSVSKAFSGMQGGSFVGLTTLSYAGIGVAQAYDGYKQSSRAERIGDHEGVQLARLQAVESAFIAAGSTVMMPLRGISMVQEIAEVIKHAPLTLNSATSIAQSVFSWASVALYGVYYILNGIRFGWGLVNWYQGRAWRKELFDSSDPVKTLVTRLQQRVDGLNLTKEEYKKLALDAGVQWLKKVAKDGKQYGIELDFKDPILTFETYIHRHPEVIEGLLGKCPIQLTQEGELIRLGHYLAIQNECAKFEAECRRKLGSKTVEALKTHETTKIKEAIASKEGVYLAVKIALAVIGLAALIVAAVFTGGAGVGVVLGLYGLGALISIYLEDWGALKEHLDKGEIRKRDKFFIYFSTCLSILAVGGLIALTVLSGGVTAYVGALILTSAWLIINFRACTILWRYNSRPWMVAQPTIGAFRKLLETCPSTELIQTVFQKMSQEDRALVKHILKSHQDLSRCILALKNLEQAITENHDVQRKKLLDDLQAAADEAQLYRKIAEDRIERNQEAIQSG